MARRGALNTPARKALQAKITELKDTKQVKVEDLNTLDIIIDPEGNEAIVRRVHRINHERARLTTSLGVAVVQLGEVFPVKQ